MDSCANIPEVPGELIDFIKTGSSFIIAGHKEPDGDCIGSQLALKSVLLRLGKEAVACSAGPFKRTELRDYISQLVEDPHRFSKPDTKVIIVDCSSMERTGEISEYIDNYPHAVIDHHAAAAIAFPPSEAQSPVYIDAASPSCTLLIYRLIKALGEKLTEDEATLLLFGLCTDTGFFRHMTEKNAEAFEATAEMIKCGASPKMIFNIMNGGKSLSSRVLVGHVLARTESHFNGRLLLSWETLDEFYTFGFESRDSDALNQMMSSIQGVEATIIIRQECVENCTVSLRSIDNINVAQIAASYDGGGHKNAAGLTMKGDITFVKNEMLNSFAKVFND